MKSKWKAASMRLDGAKIYHVYRLPDTSASNHISESECCFDFITSDRKRAKRIAAELNKEEQNS